MKVLVTGGSGFIAAHCIELLLSSGHDIVFTVRSTSKGKKILDTHPDLSTKKLSFVIVEDIAKEGAFEEAVKSDPPFEAVLHTASPFHFKITDVKQDLLDPAVNGTVGILSSIKKNAPAVQQVVVTSSFAAMSKAKNHPRVYDESSWSGITMDEALRSDPFTAYRASKQFAEQAAWDFVEQEKPNFKLTTMTPPAVFGPVIYFFGSLESINTSNQTIRDLVQGKLKDGLAPSPIYLWVDVRDLALAHVRAIERPEAVGKRVFVVAGFYRNAEIADALKKNLPQLVEKLPVGYEALPREFPYGFDNSLSKAVLGIQYRSLEESVSDSARAILNAVA